MPRVCLLILLCLAVLIPAAGLRAQTTQSANDELFAPLTSRGYEVTEFTVQVGDDTQTAYIVSPPADKLAKNPLLLFTIGGASTHLLPPNNLPTEYFLERGHRVMTIAVKIMPGTLEQLRDSILEGPDPFEKFITTAKAVLKHCVDQGWAKEDRIVVSGISRFGYLALRLMAADENLNIGAAFSPVTDWRELVEFEPAKSSPKIADLRLSNYADKLAGKKIYMAIGSQDERVGTVACCQFFLDLNAANARKGLGRTWIDFNITGDPGHTCGDKWYNRGMEILLNYALSKDADEE